MILSEKQVQFLDDRTTTGRRIDWGARKMANEYLALAYDRIDAHVAARLRDCATRLVYGIGEDGKRRLRSANFCRVRLCPICQWRKSLKLYGQMRDVLRYQAAHDPMHYIFLTLTVRNVALADLSGALDALLCGYRKLLRQKDVHRVVHGWYRGLEVTHNLDRASAAYDTYHPHLHVILAVKRSYFSKYYLSQERWTELWKDALDVDYVPICDVRRIKGDDVGAICEATKYAAKSKDYIVLDDWDLTVDTVRGLSAALHGRQLVAFGGCLAASRRALKQEDIDCGNLVQIDAPDNARDVYTECYAWHSGYCQYVRELE